MQKHVFKILFLLSLAGFANACFALPFNIVPASPLPTTISPGQTVYAYYTVTNNTGSQRNNNHVTYLPSPPNVTVDETTGCTTYFNLAPFGHAGDSCVLKLVVTGPVNASDPDPHHHLLVCFPGDTTCAGTQYPLNVTSTAFTTFTKAYVADIGTSNIAICSIPANGTDLSSCNQFSDPTVPGGAYDIILNKIKNMAYIISDGNGSNGNLSFCPVNSSTGMLNACQAVTIDQVNVTGVTLNNANTYIYYTNLNLNTISTCSVNPNGSIGACFNQPVTIPGPVGRLVFNATETKAYVSSNGVAICSVDSNSQLTSCQIASDPTFTSPIGVGIDSPDDLLLVANNDNSLAICPINPNGSLGSCNAFTGNFTFQNQFAVDLFVRSINNVQYAYLPSGSKVAICPIQNGALGTCTDSTATFSLPQSVWIETF